MAKIDLIIRNCRSADRSGKLQELDIACAGGVIERMDKHIAGNAQCEIDADGHLTLPGVIDPQVHFRDPGATHKEDLASGSRAAVSGGVTSFLEMPNTNPPTTNQEALNNKLQRAARVSHANYGFFIGATPDNLDNINQCSPVCGIKIFMGSSTGNLLVHRSEDLERIFQNGTRLIAVHAEDEYRIRQRMQQFATEAVGNVHMHARIRDSECALLATKQATELSHRYDRRLHILHLTSKVEVDYLRENRTGKITVECTPNHLFLAEEDLEVHGTHAQMNPPIRTKADQAALWDGLNDGTIDFIATDHAPHTAQEKARPYPESPSGIPGVETSLPLMLTAWKSGRCSLKQIVKWMCWGPAEAYGLRGKGVLKEGYDADIAIVDVDNEYQLTNQQLVTKVGWSPYVERPLRGRPLWTIVGGNIAFEKGKVSAIPFGSAIEFEQS